jgi:hypothetical protein
VPENECLPGGGARHSSGARSACHGRGRNGAQGGGHRANSPSISCSTSSWRSNSRVNRARGRALLVARVLSVRRWRSAMASCSYGRFGIVWPWSDNSRVVQTKSPSDDPTRLRCTRIRAFHAVLGSDDHSGSGRKAVLCCCHWGRCLALKARWDSPTATIHSGDLEAHGKLDAALGAGVRGAADHRLSTLPGGWVLPVHRH